MNVYAEAHSLERAIRESEEFKQLEQARQKLAGHPQLKEAIDDFHQKQLALQAKQMSGEAAGAEVMQSMQQLYQTLAADPLAAEYLQCEMRFSLMMQDVFQILSGVMGMTPQNGLV
ncbi:MAG: YlbF family regulator [Anaerovoracaceae bacterium]|jgi:cell fate (sporulation/competence/biofilm development) regulator YlbF (YheA/YmcA/DUF963 family)